jgi:hypothetical protein|mmetsp:Transcript_36888/g.48481  ORF Transcript_36888/g.48481 Transcript_36888/m.48481 type:complete len:80 (-) Transcript_36888:1993-2232(-)
MSAATVLNVTGTNSKMIFAYVSAVCFIPCFAITMISLFRKKYYEWKQPLDPKKPFRDIDIASYAIEVRNLPIDEGVESL